MLDLTDPDLVGLVLDTGHYAYADGTCDGVLAAFDRHRERIWYVHFKDCHPQIMAEAAANQWDYFEAVGHGVFCELGQGCVDFEGVLGWLRSTGLRRLHHRRAGRAAGHGIAKGERATQPGLPLTKIGI